MAKYDCELFIHISYSASLSYNELYAVEADLTDELQEGLAEHGAEHIDVVALGDSLRVQCVFLEYSQSAFHTLCDSVAGNLSEDVTARFLFIDKELGSAHLYCFKSKQWKERVLDLSPTECA